MLIFGTEASSNFGNLVYIQGNPNGETYLGAGAGAPLHAGLSTSTITNPCFYGQRTANDATDVLLTLESRIGLGLLTKVFEIAANGDTTIGHDLTVGNSLNVDTIIALGNDNLKLQSGNTAASELDLNADGSISFDGPGPVSINGDTTFSNNVEIDNLLDAAIGYKERGRSFLAGEWTDSTPTVSFSVGGTGHRVGGGLRYTVIGKTVFVMGAVEYIVDTSSPTVMSITLPSSYPCTVTTFGTFQLIFDVTDANPTWLTVGNSSTLMTLTKTSGNFSGQHTVYFQFFYETTNAGS